MLWYLFSNCGLKYIEIIFLTDSADTLDTLRRKLKLLFPRYYNLLNIIHIISYDVLGFVTKCWDFTEYLLSSFKISQPLWIKNCIINSYKYQLKWYYFMKFKRSSCCVVSRLLTSLLIGRVVFDSCLDIILCGRVLKLYRAM